ncbi:hypothetical protein EJB05_47186, partial [Eragrostis curvula]
MVVVRRQEEKLDEQDDDAWAAAHPPKRVPEAWVDYHRSILKEENLPRLLDEDESIAAFFPGGLDAIREINEGMRESIKGSQEMAAISTCQMEIVEKLQASASYFLSMVILLSKVLAFHLDEEIINKMRDLTASESEFTRDHKCECALFVAITLFFIAGNFCFFCQEIKGSFSS